MLHTKNSHCQMTETQSKDGHDVKTAVAKR